MITIGDSETVGKSSGSLVVVVDVLSSEPAHKLSKNMQSYYF